MHLGMHGLYVCTKPILSCNKQYFAVTDNQTLLLTLKQESLAAAIDADAAQQVAAGRPTQYVESEAMYRAVCQVSRVEEGQLHHQARQHNRNAITRPTAYKLHLPC